MPRDDGVRFAGKRARDTVTSAAAAFLELTVLIVAVVFILYPLIPGDLFLAKGPWGSYVILEQRIDPAPLHLLWGLLITLLENLGLLLKIRCLVVDR